MRRRSDNLALSKDSSFHLAQDTKKILENVNSVFQNGFYPHRTLSN